jgi:formylglycine-generating enzyme required for sulfatase activity
VRPAFRKYIVLILAIAGACVYNGCRDGATQDTAQAPSEMILIHGGRFRMGTDSGMPYEAPVHDVAVGDFYIDKREVTVEEFAKFVDATGYRTEAEQFGWSGVFDLASREWRKVDGADWRHPEGPAFGAAKLTEPVCQVSWNDAVAFATWSGKRLPTEAEFEYAARGGLVDKTYAWGDELRPAGKPVANWWQGVFPENDTGEDGFRSRAPVMSFPANGYSLHDMTGNVWEWCADRFSEDYYLKSPAKDPPGPATGDQRVIRGGSFLCAENFCSNYRVAGRSSATPDSGLNNLGFRCARDAK